MSRPDVKPRPRALVLAAALAALAGTADAQAVAQPLVLKPYVVRTAAATSLPVKAVAGLAQPTADLANPLDALAPTSAAASSVQSAVFARTAVDHRFSKRDDVTGSLGFLCGLQPGHNEAGGAAAYGADPHGRFLGAKLSFAFR
ncbi:hypothetical protein [Phenylobacterium sp.]|uniref:hypothetical protein n=1 Tax=Phenylobacterium sp. TaxID=1871053 RepID=UPI003568B369